MNVRVLIESFMTKNSGVVAVGDSDDDVLLSYGGISLFLNFSTNNPEDSFHIRMRVIFPFSTLK